MPLTKWFKTITCDSSFAKMQKVQRRPSESEIWIKPFHKYIFLFILNTIPIGVVINISDLNWDISVDMKFLSL